MKLSFRETVFAFLDAVAKRNLPQARRLSFEVARRGSPDQRFAAMDRWLAERGSGYPEVSKWVRTHLEDARERNEPPVYVLKSKPWGFGA